MSNDVWRWADPEGQQRRVRLDELRAALAGGHIAPNTPVWKVGMAGWQPAHEVAELTSAALGGGHGVVLNIPPPPLAMVAVQQDYEKKSESMAPAPVSLLPVGPEPEPPPVPRWVPVKAKMPSMPPPSQQSLPTQIGGTPAIAAPTPAAPKVQSVPTVVGMPSPLVAPMAPMEELSDSLLESGSSPDLGPQTQPGLGPPAPNARRNAPTERRTTDSHLKEPLFLHDPPPGIFDHLIADLKALRAGEPTRNKPLLVGAGVLSAMVLLGLLGIVISLASGGSASAKTTPSASASSQRRPPTAATSVATSTVTPPPASVPAPVAAPPPAKALVLGDCTVTGESKMIAPRAASATAIEGQALGSNLALGFAASPHDAVTTLLDPTSLAPVATLRTKPLGGDVRRVTPIQNGGKLSALADVERKGDRIATRRSVATPSLVDVGVADGAVVWTPHGKDSSAKIFALDGDAAVEALRAIPLADKRGVALTFRHGNTIRIGVARGDGVLEADGELSKIEGLGQEKGTLGSPSIASTGDHVVVAWADRATTGDDWSIRWTAVKAHGSAREANPFTVPGGGLGANAMSPSVASLGGGRFLLAWTEGPASNHQVRAIAFGADGSPSGSPLAISGANDNAGQPAIALNDEGRGVIAFLSAKGKSGFELHVTPISCPRQ